MAQSDAAQGSRRTLAAVLYISGVATLVFGIVLGLVFDPLFLFIAAFGIVDFVLARMYETGRLKPPAATPGEGDRAAAAESDSQPDPSYNPYARED